MSNSKKAFTLVELIVVIVILAILATIAFLSFSSQSGSARDSVRLSDTTNIRKGLELRQAAAGILPMPASISKTSTGGSSSTGTSVVTISEGVINSSVLNTLSNGIKDPSGTEYRYSTITQGGAQPLYYQLALELENPTSLKSDNFNPFSDVANAAATDTSKVAQLKGNYAFDPILPSLFVLSGSVISASGGIYNPNICFVLDKSTTNTFSNKDNCVPRNLMNLKDYDSSLVGYWDMEAMTGGLLKDLSGNNNDGTLSGTALPSLTGGLIGKGLYFNSLTSFVYVPNSSSLDVSGTGSQLTLISLFKLDSSLNNPIKYYKSVLYKGAGILPDYTNRQYFLQLKTSTWQFQGSSTDMNQTTKNTVVSPGIIEYDRYFTLAYVIDSIAGSARLYRNGSLVGTSDYPKTGIKSSSGAIYIGSEYNDSYSKFPGIIDDIKIYNRALSDSEIHQQAKAAGF